MAIGYECALLGKGAKSKFEQKSSALPNYRSSRAAPT